MKVQICCEGPECNNGRSALVREATLVGPSRGATEAMRGDAKDDARGLVSRQLAVTPHVRSGIERRAGIAFAMFACGVCGHQRVYGNSDNSNA